MSYKLWNAACTLLIVLNLLLHAEGTHEDCPWYKKDEGIPDNVKSNCICATNPSSHNKLSVQCQDIDAQALVAVLEEFQAGVQQPLELLYLNGSRVTEGDGALIPNLFGKLKIVSLQLSGCNIKSCGPNAFGGTENYLKHLSMSQNEISSVPVEALSRLKSLSLLDLSYNNITRVPAKAFQNLSKLATLKLNDNGLEFHSECFHGLEKTLRNLNLKGARISQIPEAIRNLSSLAFLDLAQNRIRELESSFFTGLHSLTALNLERNLLQTLPDEVFEGIDDTLSSLSLLNNLITHFPRNALKNLHELRVLDLGFNLLTEVSSIAFEGLKSLTLLALDGNPLNSLSETTFMSLNTTLRGISLGGRFLNCDCKLRWILEWIQEYDLQVTSRERNPQFCGTPNSLREMNFYQIQMEDLVCTTNDTNKEDQSNPEAAKTSGKATVSKRLLINSRNSNSSSSGSKEDSFEQETEENRSPFSVELPLPKYNGTVTRFKPKPRRPRPSMFTKPGQSTSTTPLPVPNSRPSSTQHNLGASMEVGSMEVFSHEEGQVQTTSGKSSTVATPTTGRPPVRNPPIRPSQVRHRLTTKPTSTTTKTTTTTTTTTSTTPKSTTESRAKANPSDDDDDYLLSSKEGPPGPSSTAKTIQRSQNKENFQPKKSFKNAEEVLQAEGSRIPVISGIGSSVSSVNLHTGSVMSVKQPTVVQHNHNPPAIPKNLEFPSNQHFHSPRPSVPPNLLFAEKPEITVQEIIRNGDSIAINWDSSKQAAGFRIIYRMFGEDTFRHGPPLAASETEYRIRNVPSNECIVVCVVPFEEILYNEISPHAGSVPPGSQCREVRPSSASVLMNHMDKITIGASAAICVTVLVAVLIFILVTKRSKSKASPSTSTLMAKVPTTSYLTPSPGPNMVTSSGVYGAPKDWDQMSVVSTKSIPRARMYHGSMDALASPPPLKTATLNPHFHHGLSTHRSFSAAHHHHHNHNAHNHNQHLYHHQHSASHVHGNAASAVNNYLSNQNRLLRTSLGSRASYDALNKLTAARHSHHNLENNFRRNRSSRNQSESLHTLNGYDTPDNWTDHDVDFYVARNHTRHDLVQL